MVLYSVIPPTRSPKLSKNHYYAGVDSIGATRHSLPFTRTRSRFTTDILSARLQTFTQTSRAALALGKRRFGKGSAKVLRRHAAFAQRKWRTHKTSETGRPLEGKSFGARA